LFSLKKSNFEQGQTAERNRPKDSKRREFEAVIQKLEKQVELLKAENEELKRAGKRQATPFARRKWVSKPKKPGRKVGQGKFTRREKPTLEQVKSDKSRQTERLSGVWGQVEGYSPT
jgi:hypothetical protein